jgi:signal transduction histidine kinase
MSALAELALNTEKMFHVNCSFNCPHVVKFDDHAAATHLFRIAQEAVSNAIKHGKARNITVHLHDDGNQMRLKVSDDGIGFPESFTPNTGMGLRIMQSRISMVGGTLTVERQPAGGTGVCFAAPKNR